MGKLELPTSTPQAAPRSRRWAWGLLGLVLLGSALTHTPLRAHLSPSAAVASHDACKQADPLPAHDAAEVHANKQRIVDWLSRAVQIPTEIFDVMGPIGQDSRWDVFYDFAQYLETAYPRINETLVRTRVNTHALVYEWEGSDPSRQPLLLAAHQDVVPVLSDTRGQWSHDPYGGEFDGERIWGRGSSDDKSGLIGAMSAIELLLEKGFQPTRTVILAFGIDEEASGEQGAGHLARWLEEKYGKDSVAMIVDEGSGGASLYGQLFAFPAVGEKGLLDIEVKVETLGGHSSVPPQHTGIGYMSLLLAQLEKHPHSPELYPESPLVGYTSCMATYAPDAPHSLRKAIRRVTDSISKDKHKVDKHALREVQDWWVEGSAKDGVYPKGFGKAMVSTTQAIDMINGGVKVNALPEVVTAIVDHRINVGSSVGELQKRLTHTIAPVAHKLSLELEAWGQKVDTTAFACKYAKDKPKVHAGKVTLGVAFNSSLEPAPVSPFTVESAAWRVLAGTTRGTYASRPAEPDAAVRNDELYVSPGIMTGNTDTKSYWNLSRNIYRFAYLFAEDGGMNGIHTVDEYINAESFVELVRWYMSLIANVDSAKDF